MRRLVVLASLLTPTHALAAELSVQPRIGWTLLGVDPPTGGLTAGANVKFLFPVQEKTWGMYAGAGADAIGITGGWYHMGIVAGPRAGGWYQWRSLFLSAGAGLVYGQLSTCQRWMAGVSQCMRWWNAWPEATVHAGYRTEDIHVGLEVSTLILRTGFGDSASVGVAGVGSWR